GHTGRVGCLAFHPGGRLLASGGEQPGALKVWDLTRPPEGPRFESFPSQAVGFSPVGRPLAVSSDGGELRVWDPSGGGELANRRLGAARGDGVVPAHLVGLSADGRRLAVVGQNRQQVRVWSLTPEGGAFPGAELVGHAQPVGFAALSGDGARVVTSALAPGRSAREVKVWDADSGRPLTE